MRLTLFQHVKSDKSHCFTNSIASASAFVRKDAAVEKHTHFLLGELQSTGVFRCTGLTPTQCRHKFMTAGSASVTNE